MRKTVNLLLSKKEFLAQLEKSIPEDYVVALTTDILTGEVFPEKNTIALKFEFANEMFKQPYSYYPLITGNSKFYSLIVGKAEEFVSEKWIEGLENSEGMFGIKK